ncbi:MAG: hypothetical protein ACYS8X_09710 [Planctomycetota bacterium]
MCPFVDKAAPPCRGRLTLENIFQAFARCVDHYESCPIYQKLLADERRYDKVNKKPLMAAS